MSPNGVGDEPITKQPFGSVWSDIGKPHAIQDEAAPVRSFRLDGTYDIDKPPTPSAVERAGFAGPSLRPEENSL